MPSAASGFLLGVTQFQNLLANFLRSVLDVLHHRADARPGGPVAALGLAHVLAGLGDQLLKTFECFHGVVLAENRSFGVSIL